MYLKGEMDKWVKDATEASRDAYQYPYSGFWANIGVGTMTRDTVDPIEIANRICIETYLKNNFSENSYDFERQVHWGPGWISTIGIEMRDLDLNPTAIAQYVWDKFIENCEGSEIYDDQLYFAVQYYYDCGQIESCLSRKVDREDPTAYPTIWDDLFEEYPALQNHRDYHPYPQWVFDVFVALTEHPDGAAGDHGSYSWKQIEEVAREKGLIE